MSSPRSSSGRVAAFAALGVFGGSAWVLYGPPWPSTRYDNIPVWRAAVHHPALFSELSDRRPRICHMEHRISYQMQRERIG